jgi:ribosomal protein S18 acetylase RimI-like enzyme
MSAVRRAGVEDAAALTRLRRLMFVEMGRDPALLDDQWFRLSVAHFTDRLADEATFAAFVVDGDESVVACAAGWLNPHLIGTRNRSGRSGYIANVATDPGYRGRGYARATTSALLEWLRGTGISTVDLHATAQAEGLYRSLGFVEPADRALTLQW